MSNAIISYPDHTLAASVYAGSWLGSLPVANLKNPLLSKKARSIDATAGAANLRIDLGVARSVKVCSVLSHNLTPAARVRITAYTDAGLTIVAAGSDINPLAWPAGFTSADVADYPKNFTYVFDAPVVARYWYIEFQDAANPDGYIELGRLWLGEANFQPDTGISWGVKLGYESRDVIEESLGGVPWGSKRPPRRSLAAQFNVLSPSEKRQMLIQQKKLTTTDEAFWITNSAASPEDMLLEAFPCFIKQPSPLNYPYFNNHDAAIEIIERV